VSGLTLISRFLPQALCGILRAAGVSPAGLQVPAALTIFPSESSHHAG
jgi:hypothetical protein